MRQFWIGLRQWLSEEPHGVQVLGTVVIALGVGLAWQSVCGLIHAWLNLPGSLLDVPDEFSLKYYYAQGFHINTEIRTFVDTVIMAIPEEIGFRLLPIALFLSAKRWQLWRFVVVVLWAGPFFGVLHGRVPGLYLQSMIGLILAAVYLKCGGMHERHMKALATSSALHALLNVTLIQLLPLFWVWLYDLKA